MIVSGIWAYKFIRKTYCAATQQRAHNKKKSIFMARKIGTGVLFRCFMTPGWMFSCCQCSDLDRHSLSKKNSNTKTYIMAKWTFQHKSVILKPHITPPRPSPIQYIPHDITSPAVCILLSFVFSLLSNADRCWQAGIAAIAAGLSAVNSGFCTLWQGHAYTSSSENHSIHSSFIYSHTYAHVHTLKQRLNNLNSLEVCQQFYIYILH